MRSSDPNFRQSVDCRKLGSPAPQHFSRKRSVQKKFRSCFLLLRSSVFSQNQGKTRFFLKKSNFSEIAFLLLRCWGFCLCEVVSFPFSLLHSPSSLFPVLTSFLSFPYGNVKEFGNAGGSFRKRCLFFLTTSFRGTRLPSDRVYLLLKHLVIRGVRCAASCP